MPIINDAEFPRVANYVIGVTADDGPFAIPFPFADEDDVTVLVDDVATSAYTISISDPYGTTGNTITLDAAVSSVTVSVVSKTTEARATQDPIDKSGLSDELDRIYAIFQEKSEEDGLSPKVAVSSANRDLVITDPVVGSVLVGTATGWGTGPTVDQIEEAAAGAATSIAKVAEATQSAVDAAASAVEAAASAATALGTLLDYTGPWVTATAYDVNDLATESGSTYICIEAHTSGTFSTDLSALKWEVFAAKGVSGVGSGDLLSSNNLSDLASPTTALTNLGVSAFAKTILDDADAAAVRTTLGAAASSDLLSLIDEDDMVTDSAARPPSQQSVKAYVDAITATSGGVGIGQTWQDVSGSRVADTSYQNTTGRPIGVCVYQGDGSWFRVSEDNVVWRTLFVSDTDQDAGGMGGIFVIPDNYYYIVTLAVGQGPLWHELR